jgi:hypothetical protein
MSDNQKRADFTEDDVNLAERYVEALMSIRELTGEANFTEENVELAERYVSALQSVSELQ